MFKQFIGVSMVALLSLSSCSVSSKSSVLNVFPVKETAEKTELVWVGTGTPSIYKDGKWVETPTGNYTFMVHQKRFAHQWKSHKIMNRTDKDYNGGAGDADQQHLFVVSYDEGKKSGNFDILSTMGNGEGVIDNNYENATMFIDAGISSMAPYSHIRLTQKYNYDAGTLNEIVELVKLNDDNSETPFMRIKESASLFRK